MSLIKMTDLLKHAEENCYGVAAVNVFNFETIRWVVEAAERERMAVIVQFYPGLAHHFPLPVAAQTARYYAEKATVPVAVHLDHSNTYELAISGLRYGYPSIMVDGSSLPYEENAALTRRVVEAAHVFDVCVEGELGHVGMGLSIEDFTNADLYTNVAEAARFVAETNVDALAIAVGNAHGHYVAVPHLDFERIRQIHQAVPVPLVLHGCSDIPVEQLQESVRLGMRKFNIATEYDRALSGALLRILEAQQGSKNYLFTALTEAQESAIDFVRGKIQILNPENYHF
jgi:ketose-bisphosphate aldolase